MTWINRLICKLFGHSFDDWTQHWVYHCKRCDYRSSEDHEWGWIELAGFWLENKVYAIRKWIAPK